MGKLNYCVGCNEAVETIDFVVGVGYAGLFISAPSTYKPLAFCVNVNCVRYGLASRMIDSKRVVRAAPKPKKHTKAKRASPKQGSAGISKEGEA